MQRYLQQFARPKPLFDKQPDEKPEMCLVIPCYREKHIIATLESLRQCQPPPCYTEVIVIINDSEADTEAVKQLNQHTFLALQTFSKQHSTAKLNFLVHYEKNIPAKQAGVGFARKLGMDEAVKRLQHPNGIIICLDADSTVSKNYLTEIYHRFSPEKFHTATIYFEHPLSGTFYPDTVYQAIYNYELHLRYYKHALHFCRFPYAGYTVGSSMAVKAGAYCRQGGMNKRKAGEDFYFLQKMYKLSKPLEINSCTVYPSPRTSTRVPFGTGKAVADIISRSNPETYFTYAFESFIELKHFFDQIPNMYQQQAIALRPAMQQFLSEVNFERELYEMQQNSKHFESFKKRFFQWFNAFKILKFIHFCRDNFYPNQPIEQEVKKLLLKTKAAWHKNDDLLCFFRRLDRLQTETQETESQR